MRIISRWKDYYDTAQAFGTDPSRMYIRETKEIAEPKNNGCYKYSDTKFVVGFCGNIFFGQRFYTGTLSYYCYNLADADQYYAEHRQDKVAAFRRESSGRRRYRDRLTNRDRLGLWFQGEVYKDWTGEKESVRYPDYFHEYQTPIWLHDRDSHILYINPLLRGWDFFRVKDAYVAYNEISNYVGGVLHHPAKPVPVPSDEIMVQIKGFDEHSFRKDPTKKKK